MVLSGMSNMAQMQENTATFASRSPLSGDETALLLEIAEGMKDSIPCTACRYCRDGCPMGLDIPSLIATYNEIRFAPVMNAVMRIEFLPEEKKPSACIACGKCAQVCPQKIDIPGAMKDFTERIGKLPRWADICRQREEIAKQQRATGGR